jgi:hypothetical protein
MSIVAVRLPRLIRGVPLTVVSLNVLYRTVSNDTHHM